MTPSSPTAETQLVLPDELKPADGRFGCGPSKVRPEALARLAGEGAAVMGTSHRQKPVRALVGEIRRVGLEDLRRALPEQPGGRLQGDVLRLGARPRQRSRRFLRGGAELGDAGRGHGHQDRVAGLQVQLVARTETPGRENRFCALHCAAVIYRF